MNTLRLGSLFILIMYPFYALAQTTAGPPPAIPAADPKLLLWAASLATGLKFALDIVKLIGQSPKLTKYMAWVALGLAVPIAFLSKYAAGTSWYEALVLAGAGPGSVIVHELGKLFAKDKPPEGS